MCLLFGCVASKVSLSGKSVVVDAKETLAVGEQADEVNIGGEDVGRVKLQGEAVTLSGMYFQYLNGTSLSVHSNKINIGGKATSSITIGNSGATVDIGPKAKDLTIGEGSSTIDIGSDASVINLSGSITVNGKPLDSRRLAVQKNVWNEDKQKNFGYLNAHHISVPVGLTQPLTTFTLQWDTGFSSEPEVYRVDAHSQRMLSIAPSMDRNSETSTRHLQVSLQISSVVLALLSSSAPTVANTSKIRYVCEQCCLLLCSYLMLVSYY
ncbi:unnamed protein product [Phytophthora fragariaefolia]|uniref:Unnamed protein product n=1 Tax=Phytophthora fragariaefolia TaxID=1490495 RepID=A0A9W6XGU6_9STRA|nr:unnamed protein product [Phytophthora fragariaefolia]